MRKDDLRLGSRVKLLYEFSSIKEGSIGTITKLDFTIDGHLMYENTFVTMEITFNGGVILHINPTPIEKLKYQIELVNEFDVPIGYRPFEISEGLTEKLKGVPIQSIGKNMCDEVSFVKKETLDKIVRIMKNDKLLIHSSTPLTIGSLWFDEINTKGEKEMTGLPYSVNFKKEKNRVTLVWKERKCLKSYEMVFLGMNPQDKYNSTTAEAHNEKFNHLYGFLMAYFKRVHQHKSKTQLKKYLNTVVYPMTKREQTAFLQAIFYDNCGMNYKLATTYLDKVSRGENPND
jgi:hypothetical protein